MAAPGPINEFCMCLADTAIMLFISLITRYLLLDIIKEIVEVFSETNWKNWNFFGKFVNNPDFLSHYAKIKIQESKIFEAF